MSDEESLLTAVFAAPEDDAPRLVYADWLEENGRAERALMAVSSPHLTESRGRYVLRPALTGVQVDFSSTDSAGTVDYTGIIEGQSVLLSTHSRINGRRARLRYVRIDA